MRFSLSILLVSSFATIFAAVFDSSIDAEFAINPKMVAPLKMNYVSHRLLINKRMDDANINELKYTLYRLTDDMMSSVGALTFDFNKFRNGRFDYLLRLSNIDLAIKQLSPAHDNLLKKLAFAHRIFKEMSEAVSFGNIFSRGEGRLERLVVKMIQLNTSLLAFLNDSGEPDPFLPPWFARRGALRTSPTEFKAHLSAYVRVCGGWLVPLDELGQESAVTRTLYEQLIRKADFIMDRFAHCAA